MALPVRNNQCNCGLIGIKNLGVEGFCAEHLAELYASFSTPITAGFGVHYRWETVGAHSVQLVKCFICDASWAGSPGELCEWCLRAEQDMRERQRHIALEPPEVWEGKKGVANWIERMERQIKAGLISKEEATGALARERERRRVWAARVGDGTVDTE